MHKKFITSVLTVVSMVVFLHGCKTEKNSIEAGFQSLSGPYLGQTLSGSDPELFLPGLITTQNYERCIAFLENGTLCVFLTGEKGLFFTREIEHRHISVNVRGKKIQTERAMLKTPGAHLLGFCNLVVKQFHYVFFTSVCVVNTKGTEDA